MDAFGCVSLAIELDPSCNRQALYGKWYGMTFDCRVRPRPIGRCEAWGKSGVIVRGEMVSVRQDGYDWRFVVVEDVTGREWEATISDGGVRTMFWREEGAAADNHAARKERVLP